jgi:hypothetical protein
MLVLSKAVDSVAPIPLGRLTSFLIGSKQGRRLCILCGWLLIITIASATNFKVLSATTHLKNGVYLLDADIRYRFGKEPREALHNGVPLTIELEIEIMRHREWLWDEAIASLQQYYRLEYYALSRQYVVINLNSGELKNFPTFETAIEFLGRIRDFPLVDASLLESDTNYYVWLRASLDIYALPAPLQLLAYFSEDWSLTSEWYTWPL